MPLFLHAIFLYAHAVIILAKTDTINLLSVAINGQAFVCINASLLKTGPSELFDINVLAYLSGLNDFG